MSGKKEKKSLLSDRGGSNDFITGLGPTSFIAIVGLIVGITGLIVGAISLTNFNDRDIIKLVSGLQSTLGISFPLSASDVTVIVTGCTNDTISPTNEEYSDGSFLFAHRCSEITDRQCVTNICNGNGICEEITTPGMECSLTEQCEDVFGPGYICNTTLCACEVMVPVNGSMYTNSLVCDNNGTMSIVMVMDAQCPTTGQLLTAIDSSSASWQDPPPPSELLCDSGTVVISNATCPTTGQVLTATSSGTAEWQDITMATASEIECATGNIIVSNATCPTTGQVLTATSSGTAEWQDITMATASEIECDTGTIIVSNATCPTSGQVLTATGPGTAEWQTPSSVSQITTSGSVNFPVPWSTPMSFTATATGNDVTISFFGASGLSSGASTAVSNAAIPVAYRPDASASMLYPVSEGVTNFLGLLTVSTGGTVTIGRSTTNGAFVGGASFSFGQGFRHTITYPLIS